MRTRAAAIQDSLSMTDEEYACELLKHHLDEAVHTEATCSVVQKDPPDLECVVNGSRWAVEVTRAYQLETVAGRERARLEIGKPLIDFGKKLGDELKKQRDGEYVLLLSGPPPGSPIAPWKKQVKMIVTEFVQSNKIGRKAFPGGFVTNLGRGKPWSWKVAEGLRNNSDQDGHRLTPRSLDSEGELMFRFRLQAKHESLAKAKTSARLADYDKICLVLINCNPLIEIEEAENIIPSVCATDANLSLFDKIFLISQGTLIPAYEKVEAVESKYSAT